MITDPLIAWSVLVGTSLLCLFQRSATLALGMAVLVSFLAPRWLTVSVAGLPFDVRLTVTITSLIVFVLRDWRDIRSPITFLDAVITAFVVLHVSVDVRDQGPDWSIPLIAYGEWALPYLAGRYALRHFANQPRMATVAMLVVASYGIGGVIETVTGLDPWEAIFGARPELGFPKTAMRFNLHRAFGPAQHPVFFGVLPLLLLPWAVASIADAPGWKGKIASILATVAGAAGTIATLSRGPILGLLCLPVAALAVRKRWSRWVAAGLVAAMVVAFLLQPQQVLQLMQKSVGEKAWGPTVELNDETVAYSSSLNHFAIFQVYGPPFLRAGIFGYGTKAISTFPPNVEGLPRTAQSMHLLRAVDNAFLLTGLRFGWLGCGLFCLLLGGAVVQSGLLRHDRAQASLTTWLAAGIASAAVVMNFVYMDRNFGFEVLWTCGLVSGLAAAQKEDSRRLVIGPDVGGDDPGHS